MTDPAIPARLQMASQLLRAGRLDQAEASLRQVLSLDPGNLGATLLLVSLMLRRQRRDEAVTLLNAARRRYADDPAAQRQIAPQLARLGEFDGARAAYRRVLERQPDRTDLYLKLALITRYSEYNADIREMESIYARDDLDEDRRRPLAYALGKVFDDLGDHDRAFDYFAAGNRIARKSNLYTIDKEERDFRRIREAFGPAFFRRHADVGIDDDTAIFVIGLPRSGTTLVERILASHPRVYGGGELMHFTNIMEDIGQRIGCQFPFDGLTLPPALLQEKSAAYIEQLKRLSGGAPHVTNKNVATGIYIGMIGVMMPNAKLIVCRRDPRDQAISFFQKDFGDALPNYYNLEELGRRFHIYRRLMEHWERVLPGRVFSVAYEHVVADPEGRTRALLEHCGLNFDPACLAFHKSEAAVSTLSLAQVRRPVYERSVGRWKHYASHLQPLLDALDRYA